MGCASMGCAAEKRRTVVEVKGIIYLGICETCGEDRYKVIIEKRSQQHRRNRFGEPEMCDELVSISEREVCECHE